MTWAALRAIRMPVLRWPHGCFADTYHWKNGVGPREKRPPIVNVFWGGVTEKSQFGTHDLLDLCWQLGRAGTDNIDADSIFVDVIAANYHLLGASPAIDAGNPASDWSNEPWPNGSGVNIGPYGNTSQATRSPAGFSDLAVFAYLWLTDEPLVDIAPEPSGDGIANLMDFAALVDYWLWLP